MLVLLKDCKNYDTIITLMTINKHLPQPADVHARRVEVRPRHLWNPRRLPLHPHGHCRSGLDFVKTQIKSTPSAHFSPIIIFFLQKILFCLSLISKVIVVAILITIT